MPQARSIDPMSDSPVFRFDDDDPAMQACYRQAAETFRYFCREIAWERRRIIPALDLASVKAPFADGGRPTRTDREVEHMWIGEVDFDGQFITGELLNSPNELKTYHVGDSVRLRLDEIDDWMYVIEGEAFGAYTVNLIRSRMGKRERQEHDHAWGLNFGDPSRVAAPADRRSADLDGASCCVD